MSGWTDCTVCMYHDEVSCDCDPVLKYPCWTLKNDRGDTLGFIQQFQPGASYYGTGMQGRTGPMMLLEDCKREVERMAE